MTLLLIAEAQTQPGPVPGAGSLVWSDDFTTFDTSKWTKAPTNWTDRYGIITAWDPALVTQSGSTVKLAVQKVGADWHGGLINTLDKASWLYGYFEVRAKLLKGAGQWGALWMMPQTPQYGGWPRSGEIDIIEYIGNTQEFQNLYATLHYQNFAIDSHEQVFVAREDNDPSLDFHNYGMLWQPGLFTFYVDGVSYGTISEAQWPAVPGQANNSPFDKPFFFLLNQTVGGAWAGPPTDDQSGKFIEIDYVKVYGLA